MNLLLILLFALAVGYSIFIKKDKLIIIIISAYLSFTLVTFLEKEISTLFSFTRAHPDLTKIIVFVIFFIILCLWGEFMAAFPNKKGINALFFDILYGFLATSLIFTLLLSLIDSPLREKIFQRLDLLQNLYKLKNLWISLPLILMATNGLLKAKKKRRR